MNHRVTLIVNLPKDVMLESDKYVILSEIRKELHFAPKAVELVKIEKVSPSHCTDENGVRILTNS